MDTEFQVGDELLIELEDECYIGECHLISKDRTRIVLKNVIDVLTNESISGYQNFFKSDIKDITVTQIDTKRDVPLPNSVSSNDHPSESISNCSAEDNQDKCSGQFKNLNLNGEKDTSKPNKYHNEHCHGTKSKIIFNSTKLKRIEKLACTAIVLHQVDRNYYHALEDMMDQQEIALLVEPCEMGRHTATSFISIFTGSKIYIFDIVFLGSIFSDLKNILEADMPRKIVYNSSKVMDNLKYNHNVKLRGFFDTLVAYVAYTGNRNIFSLTQCASLCFNLPEKFILSTEEVNWLKRPLEDDRKVLMVRKVILLFDLYQYILHDRLLESFYEQCLTFGYSYCDDPDPVAAAVSLAKGKNESIHAIEQIDKNKWLINNSQLEN